MSSPMSRRQMLKVGGASAAAAAVLAACGGGGGKSSTSAGHATTSTTAKSEGDITTLRTLNSLEAVAGAAYTAVSNKSKALNLSDPVTTLVAQLQKHHKDHGNEMAKTTTNSGGKAYTDPNPVVMAQAQPQNDGLKSDSDVLALAYALEKKLAETYQASVGTFRDHALNETVMTIGAAEAKHVTALAGQLGMTDRLITDGSFQSTVGAVKSGVGV